MITDLFWSNHPCKLLIRYQRDLIDQNSTHSLLSDIMMRGSHSGKSATIRESNHGSGVCKEH